MKNLKIVEALKNRLNDGDGFTRIAMKEDGQQIDINLCGDGSYYVCFPPYYDASKSPYRFLSRFFKNLNEVAEFLMNKGWKVKW